MTSSDLTGPHIKNVGFLEEALAVNSDMTVLVAASFAATHTDAPSIQKLGNALFYRQTMGLDENPKVIATMFKKLVDSLLKRIGPHDITKPQAEKIHSDWANTASTYTDPTSDQVPGGIVMLFKQINRLGKELGITVPLIPETPIQGQIPLGLPSNDC